MRSVRCFSESWHITHMTRLVGFKITGIKDELVSSGSNLLKCKSERMTMT